jgi:L,D-peptidoglycan transpeptidase YkuD (ErfK/YbiS/YcfS/YnhG family)
VNRLRKGFATVACLGRIVAAIAVIAAPLSFAAPAQQASRNPETAIPWSAVQQLVLVTTPDWDASQGSLRRFERTGQGWEPVSAAMPVVIGRAGAAWGVGLHPPQAGPRKQEGDGRSPAGVFSLGVAFGYAKSADTSLPYAPMDANDWCIDVVDSPLYNRIVDASEVGADAVAGSTEPMRRDLHAGGDQRYKLGFVIEHNPRNESRAGSCIFAHLWKSADAATAGCTAMAEPAMQEVLAWLQPDADPVFVLLPQQQYERLQIAWGLPELNASADD